MPDLGITLNTHCGNVLTTVRNGRHNGSMGQLNQRIVVLGSYHVHHIERLSRIPEIRICLSY